MVPKFQAAIVAGFVVAVASFAAAKPAIYSNAFGGENSNVNITVRDPDSYRFEYSVFQGGNPIEIFWLEFRLEKRIEIPF